MKPFRAKYTDWVLSFAGKFPYLVSSRLKFMGEVHAESERPKNPETPENPEVRKLRAIENGISSAGLFADGVKWKGVSVVTSLNRNELKKIHKWMRGRDHSFSYSDWHDRSVSSTDLVNSGSNNHGFVSFDQSGMLAVANISLTVAIPTSCYVTTLRLQKGVTYLSLYIFLNDTATARVSNVDVRSVTPYKNFQSINPFSKRFSIVEHHSRYGVIEQLIFDNARSVMTEVNQAATALLQAWGIKRKVEDFATTADFVWDGTGSYFVDLPPTMPSAKETSHVILTPTAGRFSYDQLSVDCTEQYINGHIPDKIGVGAIFLKSEDSSTAEKYHSYLRTAHSSTDYYTYFLNILEVEIQFRNCMRVASPIFFSHKKNARKNLSVLIESSLSLNLVEERLKALEAGISLSDDKYWKTTQARINSVKAKISELKTDIEKRKELNNGELQLSNLVWIKRYSILVGILVVVQIALSLLNVDWSDTGKDKNPIYINLFKE